MQKSPDLNSKCRHTEDQNKIFGSYKLIFIVPILFMSVLFRNVTLQRLLTRPLISTNS